MRDGFPGSSTSAHFPSRERSKGIPSVTWTAADPSVPRRYADSSGPLAAPTSSRRTTRPSAERPASTAAIERRHVPLDRLIRCHGHHADANEAVGQEDATVSRHVEERHRAGDPVYEALLSGEGQGAQDPGRGRASRRNPDFVSARGPGKAVDGRKAAEDRRLPVAIHDRDRSAGAGAFPQHEGHPIASRGNAGPTDVLRGTVEDLPRRELDLFVALHPAERRRGFAHPAPNRRTRRPRAGLAGRPRPGAPGPAWPAPAGVGGLRVAAPQEGQLAGGRHARHDRRSEAQRPRFGPVRGGREDLRRAPFPGRAVDDRPAVRREPPRLDDSPAKGQLPGGGHRCRRAPTARDEGGHREDEGGRHGRHRAQVSSDRRPPCVGHLPRRRKGPRGRSQRPGPSGSALRPACPGTARGSARERGADRPARSRTGPPAVWPSSCPPASRPGTRAFPPASRRRRHRTRRCPSGGRPPPPAPAPATCSPRSRAPCPVRCDARGSATRCQPDPASAGGAPGRSRGS